jgi:hypothetical protein
MRQKLPGYGKGKKQTPPLLIKNQYSKNRRIWENPPRKAIITASAYYLYASLGRSLGTSSYGKEVPRRHLNQKGIFAIPA